MIRLSRAALEARGTPLPVPPPRIVHVGLGAFHRAHQAWYTAHASDARDWGIRAFTGRDGDLPNRLAPQDGLYTLVERGPERDEFEIVGSVVGVGGNGDPDDLIAAVASPAVAIVTMTVTEAGYEPGPAGASASPCERIARGLDARRRAGGGPLAIVPCDNLPDNGALASDAVAAAADGTPGLATWIADSVSFVTTVVDRITPATTAADLATVADATQLEDRAPVITEPQSEWILAGAFPAGRPDWESAGAAFVADVSPYARRKLWLLNGAHTLLACAGLVRGHVTIAAALADEFCAEAVRMLWDEAERHLPAQSDLSHYRTRLLRRFANPRIEHRLDQIARDSVAKLRVRVVPVALGELSAGRTPRGAAIAVAGWLILELGAGVTSSERAAAGVTELDRGLAHATHFMAAVNEAVALLRGVDHGDRTR